MQVASHERTFRESLVLTFIRNDEYFGLHERVRAEHLGAERFLKTKTKLRFEPLPILIDQTDQRHWHTTDERGQSGQFVEMPLRFAVDDLIRAQRTQSLGFTDADWVTHVPNFRRPTSKPRAVPMILSERLHFRQRELPGFKSQLNTVISRIPPLGPIVFWLVLDVGNPSNRFDILQSKFHRSNQPQWRSVFDSQWLSIIVTCK